MKRPQRRMATVAPIEGKIKETSPNLYYNVGGPFDIMTANIMLGARGESIINGGMGGMTGVVGEANMGKTTLLGHFATITTFRYGSVTMQYDSEGTGTTERICKLANNIYPGFGDEILAAETQQYYRTDSKVDGPEWHAGLVEWAKETCGAVKGKKEQWIDSPFVNRHGKVIKDYRRNTGFIDSVTYFKTGDQITKAEEVEAGDSKKNTFYMNMGATQQDVLVQANLACARYGLNYLLAAHTKPSIVLDKYAPSPSQLKGLKPNHRIKGGGNAIVDLPNNIWYIRDKYTYVNSSSDKTPKYPSKENLQAVVDPDLQYQVVQNLRGKSGYSDLQFRVVLSQSNGIHLGLTDYDFTNDHDRYGQIEHTKNRIYSLELMPEKKWQRTTIRELLDNDPIFARVMHYTMEICYMHYHMPQYSAIMMTPKDIYATLTAMGYDMNVLFGEEVREWWCYPEDEEFYGSQYLSSADLLKMARGLYVPYWYPKELKDKLDMSKAFGQEGVTLVHDGNLEVDTSTGEVISQ